MKNYFIDNRLFYRQYSEVNIGQVYQLESSLKDLECLNSTIGKASLGSGSFVQIASLFDGTHSIIIGSTRRLGDDQRLHQGGLLLSNGDIGYIFLVDNAQLLEAIK